MTTMFDEKKTTQAAALFVHFCNKKVMHYLKLLKLLYLADRKALLSWGRPITYDRFVSMDHGPVLSTTLNLITNEPQPGENHYWSCCFSEPQNHTIELKKNPDRDELSDAEIDLIKEIAEKYGNMDRWRLVNDVMHKLPEWVDPSGSAINIDYEDILKSSDKTPQEIASILEELKFVDLTKDLFGG